MEDNSNKKEGYTVKFNVIKKRGSKCVTSRLLADYEKGTIKMIDHQSEWNGGYDPVKDGHPLTNQKSPSLPVGNNPISNIIGPQKAPPQSDWTAYTPTGIAVPVSKEPQICQCPIRELMAYGCKCGGK